MTTMSLHQSVDHLLNNADQQLRIQQHKEEYHKAMREIALNTSTIDPSSSMAVDPGNPLLIKEDLASQRAFFRTLKPTYIEQHANSQFLYSILADEPQSVPAGENETLAEENRRKKTALKELKNGLEAIREGSLRMATSNAKKHAVLSERINETRSLQSQIRDMELELAKIKATHPPEERLTKDRAEEILDIQLVEMQRLTSEGEEATKRLESTRGDLVRTAKDVQRLSREREKEEARAKEIREGREEGDTKIDDKCNWLASSISFYKTLMGIRSVKAVSNSILRIEYDVPPSLHVGNDIVTLTLGFDEKTKRLTKADVRGTNMDFGEAINMALRGDDVPGLIADLLVCLRPMK